MKNVKTATTDDLYRLLGVGTRLNVEVVGDKNKTQIPSRLVGYKKDQYLLVDCPPGADPNHEKIYIPNNELIVRAITDSEFRDVIAFRSIVMGVIQKPIKLLIISIPESFAHRQIRQQPRVNTNIGVSATSENGAFNAHMTDFSVTGCGISVDADQYLLFEGEEINLNVKYDSRLSGTLKGSIVAVNNDKSPPTAGVRFKEGTAEEFRKELFYQLLFDARANEQPLDV